MIPRTAFGVLALSVAVTAQAQTPLAPAAPTVRAVRLAQPLVIDGRLDDSVYGTVEPHRGFLQQEPLVGMPATEDTEMWIFFDARNIYVSAWCHDSEPAVKATRLLRF